MLNPSSLTQRKVSEEDSSGSEAGSDVSLEPETDRFGFIVTNGSTAGSVGPSPELVRQREAKWINIIGQWDHILMKKSSKVKEQCQKGIPASLRAKCWPLLCGASDRMKQNSKLYECLNSQPGLQSWVDIIERDLDRQFPFHEMFLSKDGHGQQGLFRVLKAYTQYQPQEGYCQAQGPVAAVLLMNMPAEEAFWCLVQISEQYLPGYYNPLLEGVLFDAALLTWALKKMCPAAHKHLQHHGVEPLMFATDWLMCLFTRHLPFNTLLRVWDLFFCYGVRVLLQVAVVLVRRVLGRPDQRKKCQGQVETLEILRGIRDQIQDEDNAFIAEVCSVPLSAKDLEKKVEKELQKWRNDRPSSTFDPRGRCHGYRMAWARARQRQEEQDRKQRETGNLSVPLARSASTLSLSPSLLHKRWRKGSKVNASEGDGGKKVVRHLSMGARDDCRSWADLNLRKVQDVHEEEDVVPEGHKAESETAVKVQSEQKKIVEETERKAENMPLEPAVEKVKTKEQVETVRLTEKEDNQLQETEKCKILLVHEEETLTCPVKNQEEDEDENNPIEETSCCEQEEKMDTVSQFQVPHQQSAECSEKETEVKETNEKREKQEAENEPAEEDEDSEIPGRAEEKLNTVAVMQVSVSSSEEQVIQADMKPQEKTESKHVQQQTDSVTENSETKTETRPDSETNKDGKESMEENHPNETETQQQHEEVIIETEEDLSKEKYHSSESLQEPEEAESHTPTVADTYELEQTEQETENNAAMQEKPMAEITPPDSEDHTETHVESLLLSSSETIQEKQAPHLQDDGGTEAKLLDVKDIVKEPNEVKGGISEQEKQVIILTERSDISTESDSTACEQSVTEETPREAQATDSVKPTEQEEMSTQNQSCKLDLVDTLEPKAPEQPAEAEETPQESPAGESNVLTDAESTDGPIPDKSTTIQDEDAQPKKPQSECSNNSSAQFSSHHSSRFSGDFCVRKPPSSRGSKLTRRLSEDLFTSPQKNTQSEMIPNQVESQTTHAAAHVTKSAPDVTRITDVSEDITAREKARPQPDPQKSLGLFSRLRGKQPGNTKKKGTPKMQVPKILIQDFSDFTEVEKPVDEGGKEKLTSKERRRIRREKERREKEEEKLKKKKEKDEEKEKAHERRKPQTRGKSFQVQKEKDKNETSQKAKTDSKTKTFSGTYAEAYF